MTPEELVLALFWSDSVRSLLALAIGFAVAGLLSSGYQLLTMNAADAHRFVSERSGAVPNRNGQELIADS